MIYTDDEKRMIANRHIIDGVTQLKLSQLYKVNLNTINKYVKCVKNNLPFKKYDTNKQQNRNILSNDIKLKIASEHIDDGIPKKDLAIKYGCTVGSVDSYVKAVMKGKTMYVTGMNNHSTKQTIKHTTEEKEMIGKEYLLGGISQTELAKKYSCSVSSISLYVNCVKNGIKMNKRGNNNQKGGVRNKVLTNEEKIQIANEYLAGGITQADLAKKYGCSSGSVHHYIHCVKNGLPMHEYGKRSFSDV